MLVIIESYLPAASVDSNEGQDTPGYRHKVEEYPISVDTDEAVFGFFRISEVDDVEDEDDDAAHRAQHAEKETAFEAKKNEEGVILA